MLKLPALTALAMLAFAANSLLARLALADRGIDAWSYTGIRLVAGAAVLAALLWGRKWRSIGLGGSWPGAAALLGYALAFSIAYLRVGAGTGALILFATVQMAMLAWAIVKGDRPGAPEWIGIAVAFAALVYLVSPGLVAPDPLGAALMVAAGLSWAVYSLIGRGSLSPLDDTAGNFIRGVPLSIVLVAAGVATHAVTAKGAAYAIASGALASGLGYAIWYAVLPRLSRTRAALVQLTVPAIAAAGGVLLLAEPPSARLIAASIGVLGGVALALAGAGRRRSRGGF